MNRPRKHLPLFVLLASAALIAVMATAAYCAAIHWQSNFTSGQGEARKSHKRMLVEFCAQWCGPCKKMEQTSFQDHQAMVWMNRFVAVRLDVDKNQSLASRYGVGTLPRFLVLSPDGKVLRQGNGYMPPSEFVLFLKQSVPD